MFTRSFPRLPIVPGFRSSVFRLAIVIGTLGVPILGTSYVVVSQTSSEIGAATAERGSLRAVGATEDLFRAIENVHRALDERDTMRLRLARERVDASIAGLERAYPPRSLEPEGRAALVAWLAAWHRAEPSPTALESDALLEGLRDLAGTLEPDSPLDFDPIYAVQNLAAPILREEPRSIAALRRTIDSVTGAPAGPPTGATIEAIATARALSLGHLRSIGIDTTLAYEEQPGIAPLLRPPTLLTSRLTTALNDRVRAIARAPELPSERRSVERDGRAAIDAEFRLWALERIAADRLVVRRRDELFARRRMLLGYAIFGIAIGALVIALIGRDMARGDRLEIQASRSEAERLRAELAQVAIERELRVRAAQFKTVFDYTDLGIIIYDDRGRVAQTNPAVDRILGDAAPAVLAAQQSALAAFSVPNRERFKLDVQRESEGETQWLELTFAGVYYENVIQMVILLLRDTTEQRALQQRLQHEANHDNLTRIANRASFERELAEQVERGRDGAAYALAYVDLDHFKAVNDTFGHAAGDRVLVASAERLVAAVASGDLCARLGGDEFAVLLRGTYEAAILAAIAQRINESLAAPVPYEGTDLHVTASIGIAVGGAHYGSPHDAKRDADLALYAVKERGRNAALVYDGRERASSTLEPLR